MGPILSLNGPSDDPGTIHLALSLDPKSQANKRCDGLFPTDYFPYYYLGVSYFRLGQFDKAREMFGRENRRVLPSELLRRLDEFDVKLDIEVRDNGVKLRTDETMYFGEHSEIVVNGVATTVGYVDGDTHTVRFLGEGRSWRDGLNYLASRGEQIRLWWLENGVLSRFDEPYKKSYALIISVGQLQRTLTEFPAVPGMVARARELKDLLPQFGFPASNITFLSDRDASSSRIESELRRFWRGGDRQDADRVFIYFGGHGTVVSTGIAHGSERQMSAPVLVTYDYDPARPALTGLIEDMLTEIHARQIGAHHVLIALDSCHAGLALPRMLDGPVSQDDLRRLKTLALIRSNLLGPARNLLLAGTGDEKALYITGGIFTEALVEGLKGQADKNEDGVVEFSELADFIRRSVIQRAFMERVDQRPDSGSLFGSSGQFMFIREHR